MPAPYRIADVIEPTRRTMGLSRTGFATWFRTHESPWLSHREAGLNHSAILPPLPSSSVTTLNLHNSYLMNDEPSTASTALNAASNPLVTSALTTASAIHNSIDCAQAAYSPGTSSTPSWTSKTPCGPTCASNTWTTTSETPLTPTYHLCGSSMNYSAPN